MSKLLYYSIGILFMLETNLLPSSASDILEWGTVYNGNTNEINSQKTSAGADQDLKRVVAREEPRKDKQYVLLQSSKKVKHLLYNQSIKAPLKSLCTIYKTLASLPASQFPVSTIEMNISSTVAQDTADLLGNVSLTLQGPRNEVTKSSVTIIIYNTNNTNINDSASEKYVFSSDTLEIIARCFVNDGFHVAFMVFPDNSSPLRPLPDVGYPLRRFNVLDVVRVPREDVNNSAVLQCEYDEFFDKLTLTRFSPVDRFSVKHGCAVWSNVEGNWNVDDCYVYRTFYGAERNKTICHCDTKNYDKLGTFILFDYVEDVYLALQFIEVVLNVGNTSDEAELRRYESLISELANGNDQEGLPLPSLDIFISNYLHALVQFDSSLLENNSSVNLLEDIGKILARVEPKSEEKVIGRSTDLAAAFMINLEEYKHDPVIAYAFYSGSSSIEYFRSSESIDLNKLFHFEMNFSFMFSQSVLVQNARYVFLLYARDKFFKPIRTINGHDVENYQVLDVLLVPLANIPRPQDQLIHLYSMQSITDLKDLEYGCAFWSAELSNWTTTGCLANPALYRRVCTCNMSAHSNESQTRRQFVVYKYHDLVEHTVDKDLDPAVDCESMYNKMCELHELRRYYGRQTVVQKAFSVLSEVVFSDFENTVRLNETLKAQIVNDIRYIVTNYQCETTKPEGYQSDGCEAVCYEETSSYRLDHASNFWYDINLYPGALFLEGVFEATYFFTKKALFAVHVSDSVPVQNEKFVFVVYPMNNNFLLPLPSVGYYIYSSRVVDIVLVPKNISEVAEQFVEIYLDQTAFRCTHECAYWDDQQQAWTTQGCGSFKVNGFDVCNCSLTYHFNQTRAGGQYIAYTYTTVLFDEEVYLRMGSQSLAEKSVFSQAAALIHNASLIPVNESMVCKALGVYLHIMAVDENLILDHHSEVIYILNDLKTMFDAYLTDNLQPVKINYGIPGSWSAKSTAVAKDLFSNAVLSSNATDEVSYVSDITVVAFGYYTSDSGADGMPVGFQFYGYSKETLETTTTSNAPRHILAKNPTFACVHLTPEVLYNHRLIFTIYPLNTSPFPRTMTTNPVFNSRQMDVYKSTDRLEFIYSYDYELINSTLMDLYFHPSERPASYINISCASWSDTLQTWTTSVCSMARLYKTDICRCELINRTLTRIIMYEYTDMPNFSLITEYDVATILFLFGACLSQFGYVVIFLTAILFSRWRKDLSNKILMNLTASSFFYLSLTMYRETHLIYADTNHKNIPLIILAVCVHYTRLTHFCWGLAMSVLQYKRFSGVVGAVVIPHLLLKVSLVTWGLPIAPLIVLLSWDQKVHFCGPDKLTHYVLYLVPGAVITALNIGLLVAILGKITNTFGCGKDKDLQRHNFAEEDLIMRRLKTVVLMFFLFGIPTAFEMFNDIGGHSEAVDYITKMLDPIQGFVMFLFFIVFDDKTRRYWDKQTNGLTGSAISKSFRSETRSHTTASSRATVRRRNTSTQKRTTPCDDIELRQIHTINFQEDFSPLSEGNQHQKNNAINQDAKSLNEDNSFFQENKSLHQDGNALHEIDTAHHPVDTSLHQKDASQQPVDTFLLPEDASHQPVDTSLLPADASLHQEDAPHQEDSSLRQEDTSQPQNNKPIQCI